MAKRFLARAFAAIGLIAGLAGGAAAQMDTRSIERSQNSDYFGFDLRTVQNVPLDQCEAACLGDSQCRAFTYNTKVKWCFLKSDYNKLNAFAGAVAGKVVTRSSDPDIGAAEALSFVPAYMLDEAVRYRAGIESATQPPERGLAGLVESAQNMAAGGDPRGAAAAWAAAISISKTDPALWLGLTDAAMGIVSLNQNDSWTWRQNATSAGVVAYQLTRTTASRAQALATLARALEARSNPRPALEAYKASLAFVADAGVQSAFDSLYEKYGFRVVDHTIDSDNRTPRVCVQFSEALVKSGVDYANFVTVDGQDKPAIVPGDREICAEGLEHGKNYTISVRQGLPAAIGEVIERPVTLNVYIRDRAPSARFTGENFVLPSTARRGIPLVTVNAQSAKLSLYRIGDRGLADAISNERFLRQMDGYDAQRIADETGEPIWSGTIDIQSKLNEEVTTSFPVDEALPERKPGVYVLVAEPVKGVDEDDWSTKATQWFVVSDIGLATYTGEDGLTVFARSLSTAKPLANVELQLLARNNEVLGKATTDAEGRATFTPGLVRGEGGLTPALVAAQAAEDFVFLDMTRAGFDLSDRGVEGRETPGAIDVYAWTERGIYRAGETVHVQALARDDRAKAIADLPLTVIFSRPDGVENSREVTTGAELGGHHAALALTDNAMRGTWTARVYTDPKASPLSEISFLVEDFTPDRIEFDMSSEQEEVAVGEPATIDIDGRYLYGAPAAGLSMEGEVNVSTTRERDGFAGFQFGLADEEGDDEQSTRVDLDELPLTDEDGKASFEVTVDEVPSTTRLLVGEVVVRMREGGGRAVERKLDLGIRGDGPVIGIKPEFEGDSAPEGSTANFKIIAVNPEGERQDLAGMDWSLVKVERNYQWYRSNDAWAYEPVTFTTKVADGKLNAKAGEEASLALPVNWGRYRLEITAPDASGPATSVEFDAGWYVSATSTETPDGLEVALDKPAYAPGETARLNISSRFAGEVLVTVGADRLLATYTATVPEGGTTVDIPVSADWGAGAYVTAALYRPGDAQESRMPMRAIGLKWLQVDPASRTIGVSLETPQKMEPRGPLVIPVALSNVPAGEKAYVTVAAVDVGILNLTSYTPPDAGKWYYGQRKLGIEMRDIYGRLIDGSLGAAGRLRTGGDGGMQTTGNPPTEKLVAFFSGIVEVGPDGRASVSFDIPQFNGTARVMAVAWSGSALGRAQADVIIRDPVVVTASMPKFLTPGDRAELRLDIANTDGPAGDYKLALKGTGLILDGGDETLNLAAGKSQTVTVPLVAGDAEFATIDVSLTHASGLTVEQALSAPVRPAVLPVTTRHVVTLAPNTGSITVDGGLLAESVRQGATVSVGVSRSAALDIPAMLMTLDRYPYGCAEQTTSRALPLLYLSELSAEAGMEDDPDVRKRVQDAIVRVLSYQSSSGSFGLWGPGYGDLWLDSYVTDFLTRAREQKYDVPSEGIDQALRNLQNALSYDVNIEEKGNEIAYALYVLARNKKASVGDLRYYSDTQIGQFRTPLARAHLAAGLALYGDAIRSEAAFGSAFQLAQATEGKSLDRSDYGSALRDGAAMLALAAESRPAPALIPSMVQLVSQERNQSRWTSTQEEAWMLLAARAIKAGSNDIRLNVNGQPHTGNFSVRKTSDDLDAAPVVISNASNEPLEAVLTTVAAPLDPLPAGGDGFAIERTYYTLDGEEANITEAAQNERYVVVLKVTEKNSWPSRVLVSDLLPAGFQIDNPSIVGSAALVNFDWLGDIEPAHVEFRNDRFIAAFNRDGSSDREFNLAYVVRAVTPGDYAHPAATVEDMYRPQFSARTATGRMQVLAAQ
ncbi:alpha-2-macroglobulin family protein [Mesorhizobium sp. J428]|uniref:alpha-2-macroglobulin family protein n=1 Tax=Mesorhizobium sp. J428 TaxID=2898440 RepID=UPI0021512D4B|nr:alpha-2-macroglobulin family protein [Mesorhizobium sp. J428]MCR5855421.1 alpha-2-macroglobulin family protein [Mesorhizobium sp. J428]